VADRTLEIKITGDASSLGHAFGKAGGDADAFGKKVGGHASGALKGLGLVAGGAALGGIALLSKGFMDGARDLIAHQKLMAQTNAVIKSTGGTAGVSAPHVDKLADSIEKMSGMDGDAIQAGENMLLTFTNIRNGVGANSKVFDSATKTLADMSQAMGSDPQKQAVMLGKALNDPVKGISALTKVGVTFDDQQKKLIKTYAEHGQSAKAQQVILAELHKEFGGSAAAAGQTMAGQVNILKAHLSDLEQEIAAKVLPVLNRMVQWAIEHWPEFQHYAEVAMAAIGTVWDTVLHPIIDTIITVIGAMVAQVQAHWDQIAAVFEADIKIITGIIDAFIALFKGDWDGLWVAVKQIFSGAWDLIKADMRLIPPILLAIAQTIGEKILEGLKAGLLGLVDLALAGLKALPGAFLDLHLLLFNAAVTLGGKVVSGIVSAVDGIAGKVVGFVDNIPGKLADLLVRLGSAGADVGGAIVNGITGAFDGIAGAVSGLVKAAINAAIGILNAGFNTIHDNWPDIPGAPGPPFGHDPIHKLAAGGIVTRATLAVIGEAGPEAVIPLSRVPGVNPLGGLGGGLTVHIHQAPGMDAGAVVDKLGWMLAGGG
jgi:hypothetical protein